MKKALVIIDVQNDFLPGGSLAIPRGNQIIPKINLLQKAPFDLIVATKDWHPKNHCSFKIWSPHCIQNSHGAGFPMSLQCKKIDKIIYKGMDPHADSYSAFFDNEHQQETELDAYLKEHQILELYFNGLATDFCIKFSVLDALDLGYTAIVVADACMALNDPLEALKEMSSKGAKIMTALESIQNL